MPDCSENYESEISDGRNFRSVKCKFCSSVILSPSSATFTSFEVSFSFCLFFKKIGVFAVPVTAYQAGETERVKSRNGDSFVVLERQ
jgi:hypothetical protein